LKIFMLISLPVPNSVPARFFQPLHDHCAHLPSARQCEVLSDLDFLQIGVHRVLSQARSGRDFLQTHRESGGKAVGHSLFFETLKSSRRAALCAEANAALCARLTAQDHDAFAEFAELASYDLYAGDGHYLSPSAHDERIEGAKHPIGHFFIFNLRTQALQHLTVAERDAATLRKSEHDMHALKRCDWPALRLGAPKRRKVLIVWDRAAIDFRYWHKAKESGIYFLSREKENMRLEIIGVNPIERALPCNENVLRDELVSSSQGVMVRRIVYRDAVTGVEYRYLTTNLRLPPGLLALLYKRRWDIEKAFDETENRFEEGKAWASSATAKSIQAQLICLAWNLCLLLEGGLDQADGVRNEPELRRRRERQERLAADLAKRNQRLPFAYRVLQRLTQRGVKLIRWIRNHLYSERSWAEAISLLRFVYARL
jgi:hypothetical protein